MNIIHKSHNSRLIKIKNNTYKLIAEDFDSYKTFWKYNINNFDIIEKKLESNILTILFTAEEIITLKMLLKNKKNKLGYKQSETLFIYFQNLIKSLEKDNCSNLLININDIMVINPRMAIPNFFYMNTKYLLPIKENKLEITIPFLKNNHFLSPELLNIKEIPSYINKKSIYFSIGVLISYVINNSIFKKNYTQEDIIDNLDTIYQTKLYYAVIRCFNKSPEDRFLLYI